MEGEGALRRPGVVSEYISATVSDDTTVRGSARGMWHIHILHTYTTYMAEM
jgi:hypothetical protein